MARCIYAHDLIDVCETMIKSSTDQICASVWKQFEALIEWTPTADVRENVKGEWQQKQIGKWIYAHCSVCHTTHDAPTNFCPNCGADMRGEKMPRYIDADALLEHMSKDPLFPLADRYGVSMVIKWFAKYRAADVVEVVRCKDCKWSVREDLGYGCQQNIRIATNGNWFCADGERRTDDGTETG